ncbi:hypothetical protein ZWY2020_003282 [Hordeum vulgare]|nr:hypothetical protein ZWY2020_003282 [Hordeum vulgare]
MSSASKEPEAPRSRAVAPLQPSVPMSWCPSSWLPELRDASKTGTRSLRAHRGLPHVAARIDLAPRSSSLGQEHLVVLDLAAVGDQH